VIVNLVLKKNKIHGKLHFLFIQGGSEINISSLYKIIFIDVFKVLIKIKAN